ncbi:LOW QUALITY PROTEIN: hypothetical protein HID58_081436 [Brassica napus]|uniref:Uncharacterized protein n=1 Tax=Brassica napus TaxID=3708 RepID=A0ABQ7YAX8_BRANA|nr:LOW QUALITY PROTEIN: hypothetical protein HID58_081436 [Brassica napus]
METISVNHSPGKQVSDHSRTLEGGVLVVSFHVPAEVWLLRSIQRYLGDLHQRILLLTTRSLLFNVSTALLSLSNKSTALNHVSGAPLSRELRQEVQRLKHSRRK